MKVCLVCGGECDGGTWQCSECGGRPVSKNGLLSFAPELDDDRTNYDPDRYESLSEIEAKNFWFVARNQLIIQQLDYWFPDCRSILEVGCGTGFVLQGIERAFPNAEILGSELSSQGLWYAAGRVTRAQVFQMDARVLPFRDELSVIGAFDVIEHIDEDELVLQEFAKAVVPGGGVIVTVPQHPWLWSCHDDAARHKRRYTREEMVEKVGRAGLRVVRVTSFVSLLLPLMLAYRVGRRMLRRESRSENDSGLGAGLQVGGYINSSLRGVMSLERALLRMGINFPIGGSLLMVAKK